MYTLIDGVQFYDKDEVDDLFAQNGSTSLSGRLDQEVIDRAAADDALGTRIDQEADRLTQESNARLLGDQTLANQLTAIEQLWSTLVSANFIDTDSNAIVVDDSGKSVRQIAHDEFYRQLVTDADDVKQQLDTLKELADYLQNNPTILTDIYTKLGLTWSLDTPTDFGTFDFSRVLAATDIDSAIVELHNTLVNKVGDLTQLTTTFKGNLVGAINEVKALAVAGGGGGGGGGGADTTQLEAKLNAEIAARTQGDTDLGNRITASVGTLSSLTTTAKDNLVAAVNEVKALAEAGGGGAGADIARLEAELNEEVTARTQADTDLGNRITASVGTLSSLTTTAKNNLVAAINEVQSEVNTASSTANTANSTANTANSTANTNKTAIGTLSSLTTTAKDNLVAAINEVQSEVNTATSTANTNKTAIGTLSSLTTTAKTNLVAAINEVQSEVNGKQDSLVTKAYTMPALTTAGTRYIKIATCPWNTATTISCHLYGNGFEDTVFINICGGVSMYADSCGWYTTNNNGTQSVIIKRGATFDSSFEVWLKIRQLSTLSVRLNVEKTYSGILNTDTSLNITATAPSGSIVEHSLMDNLSGFFGNMPSASANDNTYRYTFVVDSNAALTAWANNDRSGGKDYTSVLIRKGEWTSSKGVNLTAAGTKVVVGEAGSKLVFNNVEKGLYYTSTPSSSDYYIRGVFIEATVTTGIEVCHGFSSCMNLTECGCIVSNNNRTRSVAYCFHECGNIIGCQGQANADYPSVFRGCLVLAGCIGFSTGAYSDCFSMCSDLCNCRGQGNATNRANGFYKCDNLTNCLGVASTTGTGDGPTAFYDCNNITNCTGNSTSEKESATAFYICDNLTNCKGTGTCTGTVDRSGYGFNSCNSATHCTGTGTGKGSGSGYGFAACNTVIACKAGSHCTTGAFSSCYASSTSNSAYACADTANGGFNNTTNPS